MRRRRIVCRKSGKALRLFSEKTGAKRRIDTVYEGKDAIGEGEKPFTVEKAQFVGLN